MDFIHGVTFAPFARKGIFSDPETKKSFDLMAARTHADFVILAPCGLQDTAQSETIEYAGGLLAGDEELADFIDYIHSRGIRVALKPTVNCKNGTWRAHICFFDEDVPCEPKWSTWFGAYTEFQVHYARLARRHGCEMFIAGCEMVQAQKREAECRRMIADIRSVYPGPVSYNTDKYQEHNVTWWDAVDVISSSGYYPVNDWENQLDRIEKVVRRENKPFFFAECGCMSAQGSNRRPNDWNLKGAPDPQGQADWYRAMFRACQKRSWVEGFALWDWAARLYPEKEAALDKGYGIYGKPAEQIVAGQYCQ